MTVASPRSQPGSPRTRGIARAVAAFWRSETGATSIEYSLICALIFLAITSSIGLYANNTGNLYNRIKNAMP